MIVKQNIISERIGDQVCVNKYSQWAELLDVALKYQHRERVYKRCDVTVY